MKKYRFGENFLRSYSEPTFIARGGFGAVFKCEKNNSVFAVKVTNFDAGGQEADKARSIWRTLHWYARVLTLLVEIQRKDRRILLST
ncbi:hypothetical protein COLO4_10417 [Corchorus olitorius]|uniref:Protein kinase domain-containing protein n=1 Tax=Corchorus olitorius TaxID=93759 RepID=A0A1R3K8L7_9ROSI|nr:hypothetical protein COLO4_10417 [Corchorus olitorius]